MSEVPNSQNKIEKIRQIIKSKTWYGLDQETGAFNWQASLENISSALNITPENVRNAIVNAYTPDCLTKIPAISSEGEQIEIPLLEGLQKLKLRTIVWTVGDIAWQKEKFIRSTANSYVNEPDYFCSTTNKFLELREILNSLTDKPNTRGKRHVLIVDDKAGNIDAAMKFSQEYEDQGLILHNYHLKLRDDKADASAFYRHVEKMKQDLGDSELTLILDFDGVIADSDSVLFGPACENLARL